MPVSDVEKAATWYVNILGAKLNYQDADKAILDFANQAFFLVKSKENQTANFIDHYGAERFSLTFEVDGEEALEKVHKEFINKGIKVGEIESRGHAGRNFVFTDPDGNKFDVWSELSRSFKQHFLATK
ncbi:Metallothiol transferase FosB [Bacillus sp. B-jedd]|nr:Metallothiol transferase FosB [Bacillus sp. B-jedd]